MAAKKKPATATTKQPVWPELGSSGLTRWGGFVREEFLKELQGARGMKVYREMRDNSAIVGACLNAIEMLIRQVSWSVDPFDSDPENKERAEFITSCLHDMSFTWADTISEHLTMLPFGFAFHELVYKRRGGDVNDPTRRSKFTDGRVGWRKIPLRGQDTLEPGQPWVIDDAGGIQAMRQSAAPDYRLRVIPIEKALLFRARTEKNNPEGRSVLRNAYFSWYFVKKISEIEGIGISRDLAGMPIGWAPLECFGPDASADAQATKEALDKIVTTIARDEQEGITMPLDYWPGTSNKRFDITLLSTGGRRQFDTSAIIERYERRIAMTMLADFILMGHEQVGSFALSSDKTALLGVALGGWLDSITDIYNLHAIPRLVRFNGWPADRCPKLKHGDIEAPNLAALGDYISKCYGAGFKWEWDAGVDAHLRAVAGLPKEGKGKPKPPAAKPPAAAPVREGAPEHEEESGS